MIAEALRELDVESLRKFSDFRADTIAGYLNRDPEYAKRFVEDHPTRFLEVFYKVKPWLSDKVLDLVLHTYINWVEAKALELLGVGKLVPKLRRVPYEPGNDLIDWDETIERVTESLSPSLENVVSYERWRTKRSVALIMDHSGSMSGSKILVAALSTAVLAYLLRDEEYAVILYSDKPRVVKDMREYREIRAIVREILSTPPTGYTDIAAALRIGLQQLQRASHKERMGVLITDGIYTTEDPVPVAAKYPQLHVIGVQTRKGKVIDREVCAEMARVSGGVFQVVDSYERIPLTLANVVKGYARRGELSW